MALPLAVCVLAIRSAEAQASKPDARVQAWVTTASADLDPRAIDALSRISGPGLQLLALRAYLRAGDDLARRWSWSQARLTAYPSTTEGRQAGADIDAVEAAFATANPGFDAHANRMPRSLEAQLDHWNQNKSVALLAMKLVDSLGQQFRGALSSPGPAQVRRALMEWRPAGAAPLAAPGLSAHGQGRAFDFQIERRGQIVAGFDAESAGKQWDAAGWTRKLHAAVVASGEPFSGPLQSPYEPWHYAYTPAGSGQ